LIHTSNLNLPPKEVSRLASADAVAGFLSSLGYDTSARKPLTPEAIGLAGESAAAIRSIELMSEDAEGFLRVLFVEVRSLTAKCRFDLARVLGRANIDHLLVLTSDFGTLEFVLLDKRRRDARGPGGARRIQVVPLVVAVPRKDPNTRELRTLRGFTWTSRDGLEQFDKLRTVFEAAAFSEDYFCNRALFADHYLLTRLRDDATWADNPTQAFHAVKRLLTDARQRWLGKGEQFVRDELFGPLFTLLGFTAQPNKAQPNQAATGDPPKPDYLLCDSTGDRLTAAFVYAWDRWLDGPDHHLDQHTPDENPGASVVTALEQCVADWIIVTNGRQWRLYSRHAHSRATNFYEVDLPEALIASGDTDPNEAFRYWWLFFRSQAFAPTGRLMLAARPQASGGREPPVQSVADKASGGRQPPVQSAAGKAIRPAAQVPQRQPPGDTATTPTASCWLDSIATGSRDYAKQLGERLKERVFLTIFPHLAQGFLEDRRLRLGIKRRPTDDELRDAFEATLTLLYRLLFLLYAEARDLLPIREAAYREASLQKVKEEIAEVAGVAESEVGERIAKRYAVDETRLYDRLQRLFAAMDCGNAAWNVPTYNGGLFMTGVANGGLFMASGGRQPPVLSEKSARSPKTLDAETGGAHDANRGLTPPARQGDREQSIARFLLEHKVPDRWLALAIDHMARDPDDKTFKLAFIDYKSLEVRHLGSIYEGLLEFKLRVAEVDLATRADKKGEKYIPLSEAKPKRGRSAEVVVGKGQVYLSNDKAERKASGSYYTPDPIVEYIVEQTVGPVLDERLEALRGEFRKVRKTFDNELQKATAYPAKKSDGATWDARELAAEKTYTSHKGLVEKLFEFRALDPAMGSGHFLVECCDFITDKLLTFLNQFPINPVVFMLDKTRRNILEALGEQGVTVDPNKLTDVNLLKRHVLKRCIYGVDLNPMAVELAKVSLWLDAFTLGAPLSFLDHHLRCGNSLVGATFKDLAGATSGRLFGIDYDPLLRAIQHVLHVNKMADATAAEVKQSADEYGRARLELSGYQIVLDLLVARHFGFPKAAGLLEHGQELDLATRARFLETLPDLEERVLVERVTELAQQPDRRFFHWEIEFPEVFFGFADVEQRRLKHKDELAAASVGFDAVVGNPPWGAELGQDTKEYLRASFRGCGKGVVDTFAAFIEQSTLRARACGRLGLLLPDIFLLKNYPSIREILLQRTAIKSLVHWGMPFREVNLDVCSLNAIVQTASRDHSMHCIPNVVDLNPKKSPLNVIPQETFRTTKDFRFNLTLTNSRQRLLTLAKSLGPTVGDLFVIREGVHSGNVRSKLFLEECRGPTCHKLFFGRDEIAPLRLNWRGKWIQLDPSAFDRDKGDYFNIGDAELYRQKKILVRRTGDYVMAAVDKHGLYASNNFFICIPKPSVNWDLLCYCAAMLNTRFSTWYFRSIQPRTGRLFAELKITHLTEIPIPFATDDLYREWRCDTARHVDDTIEPSANGAAAVDLDGLSSCVESMIAQVDPELAASISSDV